MKRRRRVPIDAWSATFLAALGLAPVVTGCGAEEGNAQRSQYACSNSTPEQVQGGQTGYERCEEGFVHRPEAQSCPSSLPREGVTCTPPFEGAQADCEQDSDCSGEHAYCASDNFSGGCFCQTGCRNDSDCSDGQVCLCGDPIGRCVATQGCRTDSDCEDGNLCALTGAGSAGCTSQTLGCQTPSDACATSSDCTDGNECVLKDNGVRVCEPINCAIGRPFLVEGHEQVAPLVERSDWRAADPPPTLAVASPELRVHLGETWSQIGQMEHASVAAFARFAMQLMSLGAPPELLLRTQQAMADETEHACRCFALASHYLERPVGPGPLPIEGALDDQGVDAIIETLIFEGCVGETVAALEASEALEHVEDPVIAALLEKIAHDEREHALLGWDALRWLLETGPTRLKDVARRAFEAARTMYAEPDAMDWDEDMLLRHGVVGPALRDALRRDVIARVVSPGASALEATAAML